MRQSERAQEVADVLAITFEREDADGTPWCPPRDAAAVRHWVIDRSRELGGGLRRAVRLARLAGLADGRDYARFLYVRLSALRGRTFETAIRTAMREGRIGPSLVSVGVAGVRLHEPAMRLPSADATDGFEIGYAQMPRLGMLLDILHNALGYVTVADALQPVLSGGSKPGAADEVARALQTALNAWLSERLESPHHLRQAQHIRSFIATRGKLRPETIDDALILAFWQATATGPQADEIEGFRLYTSAARGLLRYRQALRDVTLTKAIERATDLGTHAEGRGVDLDRLVPAELVTGAWQSPLLALGRPPAHQVKWLNKRERLQLAHFLGGRQSDDDEQTPPETNVDETEAAIGSGLAGAERFDLHFRRTLLRAEVFGAAQAAIVARLRKRAPPEAAIAAAFDAVDGDAYTACTAAYAGVADQLRLTSLAAFNALIEGKALEAIILLEHLAGRDAVAALLAAVAARLGPAKQAQDRVLQPVNAEDTEDIVENASTVEPAALITGLAAALDRPADLSPGPVRDTFAAARSAARKVNREGFRPEDRSKPAGVRAIRAGIVAVLDVSRELDRLRAALAPCDLRQEATVDREVFLAALTALYSLPPSP